MNGSGSNILLAVPAALVLAGILAPIAVLDGATSYLRFLWGNPTTLAITAAAWWILAYWCMRQVASVLLLRSAGAKLRVGGAS